MYILLFFILDNTNNDSSKINTTQNSINEYKPTDEIQSSKINKTEITASSENNINEISNESKKREYKQFKFNVPGNSACDESKLTVELSRGT